MEPKLHRPSSQFGLSFRAFLYKSTAFSSWFASRASCACVERVEKEGAGACATITRLSASSANTNITRAEDDISLNGNSIGLPSGQTKEKAASANGSRL